MHRGYRLLTSLGIIVVGLLSACSGRYFHTVDVVPTALPQFGLATWPQREYWTGLVFNGAKVGFTHTTLSPTQAGGYEIHAQASVRIQFLGLKKQFHFETLDVVNADLSLISFTHTYDIDGHRLRLDGEVLDKQLQVTTHTGGDSSTHQTIALSTRIYPSSAILFYPALQGLVVGRRYAYHVYDGQVQKLATVNQSIEAYEASDLFSGNAYRIETSLHGHKTRTWMDAQARPVFEMALNGILLSTLETEANAKRYLLSAGLNKQDVLLHYSLVRTDKPIAQARTTKTLKIALSGLDQNIMPPTDSWQHCRQQAQEVLCEIRRADGIRFPQTEAHTQADRQRYLSASITVPSKNKRIYDQALAITQGTVSEQEKIAQLTAWITRNIEQSPVDVFSAMDVLEGKKAECQGHAYLYTAFARAVGIPTRVVNGLVYTQTPGGFLYHTWSESFVAGQWLPIDPTFAQIGADATHIKLLEGENVADLLPLVNVMGKLQARIVSVNHH